MELQALLSQLIAFFDEMTGSKEQRAVNVGNLNFSKAFDAVSHNLQYYRQTGELNTG